MGGRSQLSSEIEFTKIEGANHDEQTLDIRELESKVVQLEHNSAFYQGTTLPTTNLFVGREFFIIQDNATYKLKSIDPITWITINDLNTTITNQEVVNQLEIDLLAEIDLKLDANLATPKGLELLAADDSTEARGLIEAAKVGGIIDSGLTTNTNKLLGRTSAGTGAIEEIDSALPFIPSNSLTRDLLSPSSINRYKRLWKRLRGTNTYKGIMALTEQGTLVAWGRAGDSKLGVRAIGDVAVPLRSPTFSPRIPTGEYVVDFQCAGQNSYAVLSNGWVYSTGTNAYGALGHGDTATRSIFTRINWFIANSVLIAEVEADGSRVTQDAVTTFYISTDRHKLYVSGYNGYGQCGINSTVNANSPALSKDLGTDTIKKVVTGGSYYSASYLLTDSGELYSTGYNAHGQCGNGTTANVLTWYLMATDVVDVDSTAGFTTAAGAGQAGHVIFRKSNGDLYACGYNGYGQLGVGDTVNKTTPTLVLGGPSSELFGVTGGSYAWSYRVTPTGQLQLCGYNGQGQFGQGNTTNLSTFTTVSASAENLAAPPPFEGKIKLICHNGASNGHGNLLIIDTDERMWFAGHDYQLYVVDSATVINRYTEVMYNLDSLDEKIIDVKFNGYDGDYSHHFLSNHGKIYGMGSSSYSTLEGFGAGVNSVPNPSRGVFKLLRGA